MPFGPLLLCVARQRSRWSGGRVEEHLSDDQRPTKGAGIARDGVVGITRGGDPARGSISISAQLRWTHTCKDDKYTPSQDLLATAALASLPLVFIKPAIVMSKPLNGPMFARRLHVRHPLCPKGTMWQAGVDNAGYRGTAIEGCFKLKLCPLPNACSFASLASLSLLQVRLDGHLTPASKQPGRGQWLQKWN